MKNKILSGIVALSIVISALPVTTKAAVKGDITKQEYIYNISGSGGEKLITTDPPAPTIEPTQTPETIDTSKPTQTPEPEPTPTPEPTQTPEPEPTPTPEPTQTPEPEIPAVTEKPEPTDKPFFIPGYYIDLPENIFNVKVSTEQEETGKVSGQKVVFNGDTVTVKAEAAPGYVFIEWTEDGQQVSTEAEYTFVPERNINLIAIFKKNMPENMKDDTIKVGNKVKTVETVPLPDGSIWKWYCFYCFYFITNFNCIIFHIFWHVFLKNSNKVYVSFWYKCILCFCTNLLPVFCPLYKYITRCCLSFHCNCIPIKYYFLATYFASFLLFC